ncbi:hypothetical protein P171DRAFT_422488 [Karstenula rhodostoma CBS 690.94]|uniref:CENP-V/GFA domain-containing protein n=1 Tax=Karstenula rhodostoma CBS 690.94 TaxID=1392251 RepID=A0A9P4P953_9PLEO|nr:hypothetical protein P171DRAFT_422488 [Karstenula rhodostoma CBS 690.94]
MPTTGRCNCSSITVTLEQLPPKSVLCYCANCKRSGSGPCSIVYMLDRSAVSINDPKSTLKTYDDNDTKSGNTVHRSFCSNCGTPIYSSMAPDAPQLIVKGGLFDEYPEPNYESFPEARPVWIQLKAEL